MYENLIKKLESLIKINKTNFIKINKKLIKIYEKLIRILEFCCDRDKLHQNLILTFSPKFNYDFYHINFIMIFITKI